jgi:fructooligosaccharide transport system substrate-binding protein
LTFAVLLAATGSIGAAEIIKMELGVNSWGNAVVEAIKGGVKRFEAANPGVEIMVTVVSGSNLVVRVAGGAPPDVATVGLSVGGYGESGVVMPLDRFIDNDLRAQIIPEMWTNFTWQGSIWAVPGLEHGPRLGMVWNTDHVADAGLALKDNEVMTWSEFFDYADKLTRLDPAGNVVRVGYDPKNGQNSRLFTIAPSWGAEDYFPMGGTPRINHPSVVQMLQYTAERVFRRYSGYSGSTGWYDIASGRVSAVVLGAYAKGEIHSRNPEMPIAVTWLPHNNRRRIQQVNGWALSIPTGVPNPELSFKLVKFLATDVETGMAIYKGSGFMGSSAEFYRRLGRSEQEPVPRWFVNSLSGADHIDAPKPDPFRGRSDSLFASARDKVYAGTGATLPLLDEAQRLLESEMREVGR